MSLNETQYKSLVDDMRASRFETENLPETVLVEMFVTMGCILRLVESEPARFRETSEENSPPGSLFVLGHSLEDLNRALLVWQNYTRSRNRNTGARGTTKKYNFTSIPPAS